MLLLRRLSLECFLFEEILAFLSQESFFQSSLLDWMIYIDYGLIECLMHILRILFRLLVRHLLRHFVTNYYCRILILLWMPLLLLLLIDFAARVSPVMTTATATHRFLFLQKL